MTGNVVIDVLDIRCPAHGRTTGRMPVVMALRYPYQLHAPCEHCGQALLFATRPHDHAAMGCDVALCAEWIAKGAA